MYYYPCYNWDTGEVIGFVNPDAWARAALISDSNEHVTTSSSNDTMNTRQQHFKFVTTPECSSQENDHNNSDDHLSVGTNEAEVVPRSGLKESTEELKRLLGFSGSLGCDVEASSPPTANVQLPEQKEEENWRNLLNCKYCRENGEEEVFYRSHALRDQRGNLMCPILWQQTCPYCSATGDKSHEPSDCPLNNSTVISAAPVALDRADIIAARVLRRLERRREKRLIRCVYCRYHKQGKKISRSHVLKDENGFITCPVLQEQVCPVCFATGPLAHTVYHCPYLQ